MTAQAGMPLDFWENVRRYAAEEVDKYARSGASRNSSITGGSGLTISGGGALIVDGGQFRVKHPEATGGVDAVYVGPIYNAGVYSGDGLLVQSRDGTDMLMARYDQLFNGPRVEMYDSGNRIIVGNDAAARQGLARPYLDSQPRLVRYSDWPTFSVAATSVWESVYAWAHVKQHPRLEVGVYASMDTSGTTGDMRVLVDGVQLGSTSSIAFAQGPSYFGPANVAGAHMKVLNVELQIQRTTATGSFRLAPAYCRGRQSP